MESTRSENYTDPDSDWIAIFSERVLEAAVSRVRNEFAESTWACFEATWLKRQPTAEVAEALTIPIQSVYVNKSRVTKAVGNGGTKIGRGHAVTIRFAKPWLNRTLVHNTKLFPLFSPV